MAWVQASAREPGLASVQASVWAQALVLVMAQVPEPTQVLAREPGPRRVVLTSRRQRMLPRSAQTPQAEELT